jgi:hypothetical protein
MGGEAAATGYPGRVTQASRDGLDDLRRSIEAAEAALARLRSGVDVTGRGAGLPSRPPTPQEVEAAQRTLDDLAAAARGMEVATKQLGAATRTALEAQSHRVERMRRATEPPGGPGDGDNGKRRRIPLTPWLVAVGAIVTIGVSLLVDWGIDPFRGQPVSTPGAPETTAVERVPLPPANPTGGTKGPPEVAEGAQTGGAAAPAVTLPSPGADSER